MKKIKIYRKAHINIVLLLLIQIYLFRISSKIYKIKKHILYTNYQPYYINKIILKHSQSIEKLGSYTQLNQPWC